MNANLVTAETLNFARSAENYNRNNQPDEAILELTKLKDYLVKELTVEAPSESDMPAVPEGS